MEERKASGRMRFTRSKGCQPVFCLSNQAGSLYHVAGFALPIASSLIFQSFLVLWIGKKILSARLSAKGAVSNRMDYFMQFDFQ